VCRQFGQQWLSSRKNQQQITAVKKIVQDSTFKKTTRIAIIYNKSKKDRKRMQG